MQETKDSREETPRERDERIKRTLVEHGELDDYTRHETYVVPGPYFDVPHQMR